MRAIWKSSINFGRVYIPVSVYPAAREEKISFEQHRANDLGPDESDGVLNRAPNPVGEWKLVPVR